MKIIYEPHPVSPERKKELVSQGYKIIDAVYAPPEGGIPEEESPEKDKTKK